MAKKFDISVLLRVIDKATRPLSNVSDAMRKTQKSAQNLGKSLSRVGDKASKAGKKLSDIGSSIALKVSAPLAAAGLLALKSSADIETMTVSFESMLGSAEKADKIMKELINFTAKTPFQLQGVGQSAKTLLAFGVAQEDVVDRLKVLGDIASGTNAPLTDIANIFGKIKTKNKAMTEEILQLAERGIPIIDDLAKTYGVSKDAIFEMASESKISFEVVSESLTRMTKKGGIFENQMEKQSRTLSGVFSTLKDNVVLAFGAIGNSMVKTLKLKERMNAFIAIIQKMTAAFIKFSEANPGLTKLIFLVGSLLVILGPVVIALGAFVSSIGFIISGLGTLATVFGVTIASIAGFAVAAAAALAGLVAIGTLVVLIIKDFERFNR
jgi:tape measure domain-containing protein